MLLVPNMLRCCLAICFELSGRKVNTFLQIHKIKCSSPAFKYDILYLTVVFMQIQRNIMKKYIIPYFYLVTYGFMIIFAEKYSILDYGAERFDEGEARGAFADSARSG